MLLLLLRSDRRSPTLVGSYWAWCSEPPGACSGGRVAARRRSADEDSKSDRRSSTVRKLNSTSLEIPGQILCLEHFNVRFFLSKQLEVGLEDFFARSSQGI